MVRNKFTKDTQTMDYFRNFLGDKEEFSEEIKSYFQPWLELNPELKL